ncbi:MAG: choice-of-anchor J domain-containing protein [Chryseolinea sp.]
MRQIRRYITCLVILVLTTLAFIVNGQDRCGTVEYKKRLQGTRTVLETREQFERWLLQKQSDKKREQSGRTHSTLQVPVVVHVIHNGEAIGVGKNIPAEQVVSQLNVLNKDYNRLNDDAPSTPAEFLPVAGAFDIEFILAKQDPEGLATTGIVRVKGTKTSWTMNDNYELKSLSYWPAEDYLNIWVCNLTDYLGYSQFPVSGLPGLENSSTNRLTDGVVITNNAFGSIDDGAFALHNVYNKGRTATHEVGHFFGLNHIWGDDDDSCSGTDNVADTPNQSSDTGGCPSHPRVTCNVTSMFQNYLDYTNDACMNLFTIDQVNRMETIIGNSPRRASLTTSPGLSDPVPLANDAGIRAIVSPTSGECQGNVAPSIEIRNYGSNPITSVRVRFTKDGIITETLDFLFNPAILPLGSSTLNFAPVIFSSGDHGVTFQLLQTNGVADGQSANNQLTQEVDVPDNLPLPFLERFNSFPAGWEISNPDQNISWALAPTNNGNNTSLVMNFYDYEDNAGERDLLITPVFNLDGVPAALLKFEIAYSRYESSNDGLRVILLSDCNADIEGGTIVYSKFGENLETADLSNTSFVPNSPDDWRTETIDLSGYTGQGNFQLAFVGYNDWGNNLYLDNIGLTTSSINDVVLQTIIEPSPVTCMSELSPVIRVQNSGTLISSFTVITTVNGTTKSEKLTDLEFTGNTTIDFTLQPITLRDGVNSVTIEVTQPDDELDFFPDDNLLETSVIVNNASDEIPLREDFNGIFEDRWILTNPAGGQNWEPIDINTNTVLVAKSFSNKIIGDESWLVSPVLDFSNAEEATLQYDRSYALRENTADIFYVLASTDCGYSFTDTLYAGSGARLADDRTSESSWTPDSDSDWQTVSLKLPSLVGLSDVRIAIVFVNDQGNNIYLDNVEFFVSFSPFSIDEVFSVYPNPVIDENAKITFNLSEKSDVTIDIVDAMGKILTTEQLPGILNQSFPFQMPVSNGIYLVRVTTDKKVYHRKILVTK